MESSSIDSNFHVYILLFVSKRCDTIDFRNSLVIFQASNKIRFHEKKLLLFELFMEYTIFRFTCRFLTTFTFESKETFVESYARFGFLETINPLNCFS